MSAPRSVELITHSLPGDLSEAIKRVCAAAGAAGVSLIASDDEIEKCPGAPLEAAAQGEPDLCLVLGGDGTILRALRRFAGTGTPVFAVNFGTIGFLSAVDRDQLDLGLERALAGDFEVVPLPGLEATQGGEPALALNDVTVTRLPQGPMAELSYRLGGEELGHVRCDGLVAATPAGSTGYNLANGGPVLAWGVAGFAVSFIAPHTLTARSLVVAPGDVLQVSNVASREAVQVACDGGHVLDVPVGDRIEVTFRDAAASLAQLEGATFYHRMREKFGLLADRGIRA